MDRPRSTDVTEGVERAPARAMLRAVGFDDDDFAKPQVGVVSSWNEVTPCNVHLDRLAKAAKEGVRAAGGVPVGFPTAAVLDGLARGPDGLQAVGSVSAGSMSPEELKELERSACPGPGSCAGMYTANTMAAAVEALGLSLPGSASPPAVDPRRDELARASGEAVVRALEADL